MLSEIVRIVNSPTKDKKGLRLVQRVYKEGFKEFVDIAHLEIEEFSQGALTYGTKKVEIEKKSIEIEIESIPKLIEMLKDFSRTQRTPRVVSAQLITDPDLLKKLSGKNSGKIKIEE